VSLIEEDKNTNKNLPGLLKENERGNPEGRGKVRGKINLTLLLCDPV
jgi:hypothetical protein